MKHVIAIALAATAALSVCPPARALQDNPDGELRLQNSQVPLGRNLEMAYTYDGTLVAAWVYDVSDTHDDRLVVAYSKNNGIRWTIIHDADFMQRDIAEISLVVPQFEVAEAEKFAFVVMHLVNSAAPEHWESIGVVWGPQDQPWPRRGVGVSYLDVETDNGLLVPPGLLDEPWKPTADIVRLPDGRWQVGVAFQYPQLVGSDIAWCVYFGITDGSGKKRYFRGPARLVAGAPDDRERFSNLTGWQYRNPSFASDDDKFISVLAFEDRDWDENTRADESLPLVRVLSQTTDKVFNGRSDWGLIHTTNKGEVRHSPAIDVFNAEFTMLAAGEPHSNKTHDLVGYLGNAYSGPAQELGIFWPHAVGDVRMSRRDEATFVVARGFADDPGSGTAAADVLGWFRNYTALGQIGTPEVLNDQFHPPSRPTLAITRDNFPTPREIVAYGEAISFSGNPSAPMWINP
jgi:hypothetical protein